jgi:DUF971 family protein
MAGLDKNTPLPTEIRLHQAEMWNHYLKRLAEAGANREKQ